MMSTFHRALKALPREELEELALLYAIETTQRRLDVEYALLAKRHHLLEAKALALLRRAMQRETAV